MTFAEEECATIRRHCGYRPISVNKTAEQTWRLCQIAALLEFRMHHLSGSEETVVRQYLATLAQLELTVSATAPEQTRLLDDWRRRLCGFLGIPPGPALHCGVQVV